MSSQDGRLPSSTAPKVVVATTVALSFISFWRGASIVLSDLASSAFYAGGAAEQAVGKSAPWFVLGVMLFSFAVRSVYMESCSMFVRGGVYVVVRDSMGPVAGEVFGLRAGVRLHPDRPHQRGQRGAVSGARCSTRSASCCIRAYRIDVNTFAAGVAVLVTIYFWWAKHQGRARIQRQGAAHHADHHRDGGDPADLVPAHDLAEGPLAQSAARADRLEPDISLPTRRAGSREPSGCRFRWSRSSSRSATRCFR